MEVNVPNTKSTKITLVNLVTKHTALIVYFLRKQDVTEISFDLFKFMNLTERYMITVQAIRVIKPMKILQYS